MAPISIQTAVRTLLAQVLPYTPQGIKVSEPPEQAAMHAAALSGRVYFLFQRPGWGINGDVTVRFERVPLSEADRKALPQGARKSTEAKHVPYVRVKWSTTEFNVAGAITAAKCHREVAEFAALVEHALNDLPLVLWEFDENVPKEFRPEQPKG